MLTFRDVVDLVSNHIIFKIVVIIILSAFIWVPLSWVVFEKVIYAPKLEQGRQQISYLEKDMQQLQAKNEKNQQIIENFQSNNKSLEKQLGTVVFKDLEINNNKNNIFDLNEKLNSCIQEKTHLDVQIKELSNVINVKDKMIENLSVNEGVITQIKSLQKERHDLLNPGIVVFRNESSKEIDLKAESLNKQIIDLQKSITCKN
ncbi:hypothetical protein M5F66_14540 [Acinetobacter sp. ANC 5033]|uniref:hypothetical protein n=1 Tax=Acinetobacter amyesii TaxID=2942470 RepID=UPI00201B876C|nr:hypothetical protein [Acinetobacter amyesii]MCL6239522.1 hypothetical protein [Acinetobacter amyesii]